jgi:hypothetical protein
MRYNMADILCKLFEKSKNREDPLINGEFNLSLAKIIFISKLKYNKGWVEYLDLIFNVFGKDALEEVMLSLKKYSIKMNILKRKFFIKKALEAECISKSMIELVASMQNFTGINFGTATNCNIANYDVIVEKKFDYYDLTPYVLCDYLLRYLRMLIKHGLHKEISLFSRSTYTEVNVLVAENMDIEDLLFNVDMRGVYVSQVIERRLKQKS